MKRIIGIANGEKPVGHVVESAAGGMEPFGKRLENAFHVIALGKAVFSGDAVVNPAQLFIIFQIRKAAHFRAKTDAIRKNTREKKRIVADMRAEEKTGAVVGRLQGSHHFKKIIKRIGLAGKQALRPGGFGEGGKHFRDVIGDGAVVKVRALKDMAHEHIEVKTRGNPEAAAAFQESMKQGGIVENLVTGILIGQKFDETFRRSESLAKHFQNKFNILGRELHPAVGLNHFHGFLINARDCLRKSSALLRPYTAFLQNLYSIISSKQRGLTMIANWIKM